jgi:large conductance mechanosensitive channel
MLNELRGNVMDMAVGIIIGFAFSTIVRSLVDDIIMPPIGAASGRRLLKHLHRAQRPALRPARRGAAGRHSDHEYRPLHQRVISFLIVFVLFMAIKAMNQLRPNRRRSLQASRRRRVRCSFSRKSATPW